MVVRKKKRVRKFRGKRSYGYGSHKKHRGGGSRGGRGMAGMHKHKWSYTIKYDPDHFGKRGFKRPTAVVKKIKAINLRQLKMLAAGKKKLDLTKLGYNKVLGSGNISSAIEVVAEAFSKKAIEKIEAAGGKVILFKGSKQNKGSKQKSKEKSENEISENETSKNEIRKHKS